MTQWALSIDKLKTSQKLNLNIAISEEIKQIFDPINMIKGSCLFKMLAYTFTENTFRETLSEYLNKFMYSTATNEDIWETFPQGLC